jgi:hypothetical protein
LWVTGSSLLPLSFASLLANRKPPDRRSRHKEILASSTIVG